MFERPKTVLALDRRYNFTSVLNNKKECYKCQYYYWQIFEPDRNFQFNTDSVGVGEVLKLCVFFSYEAFSET
jgi:hypothetical protein